MKKNFVTSNFDSNKVSERALTIVQREDSTPSGADNAKEMMMDIEEGMTSVGPHT